MGKYIDRYGVSRIISSIYIPEYTVYPLKYKISIDSYIMIIGAESIQYE